MAAAVTVEDVAVAIGRPISDSEEQAQVEQWVDDVDMILAARIGDLSTLDQNVLRYVEREAVISRMRARIDQDAEAGAPQTDAAFFLGVLDPWWALLKVPSPTGATAFTIRTAPRWR